MNKGWIKLHRNITDWEWFDDKNCLMLLIYLNVNVNVKNKVWKGVNVKRGSLITGRFSITKDLGISIQQYRTALDKLVKSGEVVKKATNKYTMLSLTKWEKMQHEQQTDNKQITNEQQTNNKQITTTKECKESKESKEVAINKIYDDFIREVKDNQHQGIIEQWYMTLKIKNGALTPILKGFKVQLLTDSKVHKNTHEFRKHFYNYLNRLDAIGKLNEYKHQKTL